jgi:hypothetical protein
MASAAATTLWHANEFEFEVTRHALQMRARASVLAFSFGRIPFRLFCCASWGVAEVKPERERQRVLLVES